MPRLPGEPETVQDEISARSYWEAVMALGKYPSLSGALAMATPPLRDLPTRKYEGIIPVNLYDHIWEMLFEKYNFILLRSDRDIGILVGYLDIGIVKKIWVWNWEQYYYASYDLRPELTRNKNVHLLYKFWVSEKPPLSSNRVKIEIDDSARKKMNALLREIDMYVLSNGGRF
jgi:hypothetical protein